MTKAEKICHICMEVVCEMYGLKKADMTRRDRHEPLAFYRQMAMSLSYELSELSTQSVANAYSRIDHGTVLAALSRVKFECRSMERKLAYNTLREMALERIKWLSKKPTPNAVQPK